MRYPKALEALPPMCSIEMADLPVIAMHRVVHADELESAVDERAMKASIEQLVKQSISEKLVDILTQNKRQVLIPIVSEGWELREPRRHMYRYTVEFFKVVAK